MYLLELNDVALSLRTDRRLLYAEPAQALYLDGALQFGDTARANSRVHPLESNNLYLERLSTEPLSRPLGPAANYGDLVYRHFQVLAELTGELPICVSVPASLTPAQLSILLGIAHEAELHVVAFVDTAVLAASAIPVRAQFCYLDIHLHQLVLTRLEQSAEQVRRVDQQVLSGCGAQALMDGWINLVADRFVQSTRFDPLHSAASEQQLQVQLDHWRIHTPGSTTGSAVAGGAAAGSAELTIEVQQSDNTRRVAIPHAALHAKTAQRLGPLGEQLSAGDSLLLSPVAAGFPGIGEFLSNAGLQWQQAREPEIEHALATHPDLFAERQAARFFSELSMQPARPTSHAPRPRAAGTALLEAQPDVAVVAPEATHLVEGGIARSIAQRLLETDLPLARSSQCYRVMQSREPVTIEGQLVAPGTPLRIGQIFNWQNRDYLLIALAER